jgi:hypothetical protein
MYIPNARQIFKMAIKYMDILQSKALQNLPRLGFWLENKPSGNPAYCHNRAHYERATI